MFKGDIRVFGKMISSKQGFKFENDIVTVVLYCCVCSFGCGIGFGYLHRIPTLPFTMGKKISFPAQSRDEAASTHKDGFTEVTQHFSEVTASRRKSLLDSSCFQMLLTFEIKVILVTRSLCLLSFQPFQLLWQMDQSGLSPAHRSALTWLMSWPVYQKVLFNTFNTLSWWKVK